MHEFSQSDGIGYCKFSATFSYRTCDTAISFHSVGPPLEKLQDYLLWEGGAATNCILQGWRSGLLPWHQAYDYKTQVFKSSLMGYRSVVSWLRVSCGSPPSAPRVALPVEVIAGLSGCPDFSRPIIQCEGLGAQHALLGPSPPKYIRTGVLPSPRGVGHFLALHR